MIDFFINLRDEEINIKAEMSPAEPDVGIMEPYPDEWTATKTDGTEVDWEWSEEEVRKIEDEAVQVYVDSFMEED